MTISVHMEQVCVWVCAIFGILIMLMLSYWYVPVPFELLD